MVALFMLRYLELPRKCSKFKQYSHERECLLLAIPLRIHGKYLFYLPLRRSRVCQNPFVEPLSLSGCHTHPGDVTAIPLLQ